MSGESTMELDFFSMDKEASAVAAAAGGNNKIFERRRSFRDIQSAISKINPEVVKAVIESAKPPMIHMMSSLSLSSNPKEHQIFPNSPLPLSIPSYGPTGDCGNGGDTQMTIFYNGSVSVFDDVPQSKAEYILKLAEEDNFTSAQSNMAMKVGIAPKEFVGNFKGYFPLMRTGSLKRFLEKRKERLVMGSPYIKGSRAPSQSSNVPSAEASD